MNSFYASTFGGHLPPFFRGHFNRFFHKFPEANVIRPFKAITYFDDIDFEEDVIMLNFEYDWNRIAERLKTMTVEQNRIFTEYPLRKKPQISVEEHDAVSHRHGRKR